MHLQSLLLDKPFCDGCGDGAPTYLQKSGHVVLLHGFDNDCAKYAIQCFTPIGDLDLILDWGVFDIFFDQMGQIVSLELRVLGEAAILCLCFELLPGEDFLAGKFTGGFLLDELHQGLLVLPADPPQALILSYLTEGLHGLFDHHLTLDWNDLFLLLLTWLLAMSPAETTIPGLALAKLPLLPLEWDAAGGLLLLILMLKSRLHFLRTAILAELGMLIHLR